MKLEGTCIEVVCTLFYKKGGCIRYGSNNALLLVNFEVSMSSMFLHSGNGNFVKLPSILFFYFLSFDMCELQIPSDFNHN